MGVWAERGRGLRLRCWLVAEEEPWEHTGGRKKYVRMLKHDHPSLIHEMKDCWDVRWYQEYSGRTIHSLWTDKSSLDARINAQKGSVLALPKESISHNHRRVFARNNAEVWDTSGNQRLPKSKPAEFVYHEGNHARRLVVKRREQIWKVGSIPRPTTAHTAWSTALKRRSWRVLCLNQWPWVSSGLYNILSCLKCACVDEASPLGRSCYSF